MNLRNRTYPFERIMKPFTISDKIIEKMDTKNFEKIVKEAIDLTNEYNQFKATKPNQKRLDKRNGIYKVNRSKVVYSIPEVVFNGTNLDEYNIYLIKKEEVIKLVNNLKERYIKNQLNSLTSKGKTEEQIIKHFRGQGIDIKSNL